MGWLAGFNKRIKLTLDSSDVDITLANFPVLIYLSSSSGITSADVTKVFDELGSNSLKIAVTTDDGVTQQYVEVVSWDNVNEIAELWTKVVSVSSSVDTILYLYYSLSHSDNSDYVGVTGSTPAENVWNNNFKAVYHMNDNPDTSHIMDSTTNDNDGTKSAPNEPIEATGKIGKGQDFDDTDDSIDCGSSTELDDLLPFTYEAWINPDAGYGQVAPRLLHKGVTTSATNVVYILSSDGKIYVARGFATTAASAKSSVAISTGVYSHIVVTLDATKNVKIYINNVDRTNAAVQGVGTITTDASYSFIIGNCDDDTRPFDGIQDEHRISSIVRSVAWVGASYETQRDYFITYSSEEVSSELSMILGETWLLGK